MGILNRDASVYLGLVPLMRSCLLRLLLVCLGLGGVGLVVLVVFLEIGFWHTTRPLQMSSEKFRFGTPSALHVAGAPLLKNSSVE